MTRPGSDDRQVADDRPPAKAVDLRETSLNVSVGKQGRSCLYRDFTHRRRRDSLGALVKFLELA